MDDTSLVQPMVLFATEDRLYAIDMAYTRVASMDAANGQVLWYAGRPGSGPGEFRAPLFAGEQDGHLVLWDRDVRRLSYLKYDGDFASSRSVSAKGLTYKICLLKDDQAITTVEASDSLLIRNIDVTSGATRETHPLPWPAYQGLPSIAAQQMLTSIPDGCLAAPAYGSALARYDQRGALRDTIHLVEQMLPPAAVRKKEGAGVRSRLPDGVVQGVIALAQLQSYVVVAFGGASALSRQIIDFYFLDSGTYAGSLATDNPISTMSGRGDMLYVLTENDEGYFHLEALQLAPRR